MYIKPELLPNAHRLLFFPSSSCLTSFTWAWVALKITMSQRENLPPVKTGAEIYLQDLILMFSPKTADNVNLQSPHDTTSKRSYLPDLDLPLACPRHTELSQVQKAGQGVHHLHPRVNGLVVQVAWPIQLRMSRNQNHPKSAYRYTAGYISEIHCCLIQS